MVWYLLLPSIPIWCLRYFGHMRVKGLLYSYCVYICACVHVCAHTCACMCMCACVCVYMCVSVCACLCLCGVSVSVCVCYAISQHTLHNTLMQYT